MGIKIARIQGRVQGAQLPSLEAPAMEIVVVDAFSDRPFAGNPAAVCRLPGAVDGGWMKNLAREMNLSETAFLIPEGDGYRIRWLTPAVEVDLCGHATLASAHVLFGEGAHSVSFSSRSGPLTAARLADGWIRLDFPGTAPAECEPPEGLLEALGCQAVWVGRSRFDYLVEVDSEATVRSLQPDHSRLGKLDVRGIMVTARGQDHDFVSRFFAPGRCRRRPRHRLGPLLADSLLGRQARQEPNARLPGLSPRRRGPRGAGRRARLPGRPGRYRVPSQVGGRGSAVRLGTSERNWAGVFRVKRVRPSK